MFLIAKSHLSQRNLGTAVAASTYTLAAFHVDTSDYSLEGLEAVSLSQESRKLRLV